jgi:hypothetical protein
MPVYIRPNSEGVELREKWSFSAREAALKAIKIKRCLDRMRKADVSFAKANKNPSKIQRAGVALYTIAGCK